MEKHTPTCRRVCLTAACWLLVWIAGLLSVPAAEMHSKKAHAVIAGYLHAFPAYVEWPAPTNYTNTAPWSIGVLGDDVFGDSLMLACTNRPVKNRPFQLIRATSAQAVTTCDLVYFANQDAEIVKKQLAQFTGRPVLTIGETENFLEEGGIIRMEIGRRVQFSVNLDAAREAGLKIPAQMLQSASGIYENGHLRPAR